MGPPALARLALSWVEKESGIVNRVHAYLFHSACCVAACFPSTLATADEGVDAPHTVIVVVGAAGTEDYGAEFRQWAETWRSAAGAASAEFLAVGLEPQAGSSEPATADKENLRQLVATQAGRQLSAPLWIVLLGHGTFDGKTARFNLRGPDFSAAELAEWCAAVRRPLAVINCSSASAPFVNALAGEGRIVIAATRSGAELNYCRFGRYLAEALCDRRADLDKDEQVSLLEAFIAAAAGVATFYEHEGRLATEHAILDDNGDGLGTPGAWFRGVRAIRAAREGAPLDGPRAHQLHLIRSPGEQQLPADVRARRDALELDIVKLRAQKSSMAEDTYYDALEKLLIEFARLQSLSPP
jgi:hypothetical protein